MSPARAIMSWSSGKDSAFALHQVAQQSDLELVGVITTVTDDYKRVSMHGVRESVLDRQIVELGLPCRKLRIPAPCPNDRYEAIMAELIADIRDSGVDRMIFGDLFLEDIRAYRENNLAGTGITAVFPLWQRDTAALAREMIDAGLEAIITCVDPRAVDPSFAGRRYDHAFLDDLPDGVDPCGERGEFHTLVVAGPMLRQPLDVRVGEVVERDGFVFADVALN
jgi:uncharacterized protein (TIGR00290 family)